jgi:hypothetical protein
MGEGNLLYLFDSVVWTFLPISRYQTKASLSGGCPIWKANGVIGEGKRAGVAGESSRAVADGQGIERRWGVWRGLWCYPREWATRERLSAMCWKSTRGVAAVNHRVRKLVGEDAWRVLGIAQQRIGWAGRHSRSDAGLEGEAEEGESTQHF